MTYRTKSVSARLAVILVIVAAGASCRTADLGPRPQIVQPGAPGEPTRVITIAAALDLSGIHYTAADVRFMQGMIGHHAQAVEMAALLPSRSNREDMRLLARRIEVSQADEITMMQSWLEVRGQTLPDPHAHHVLGAVLMPGMLTVEDMSRLAAATGALFDRVFLDSMIRHHEGALVMVADLFASAGAGQDSEIFGFASDVEADQRIEIQRMATMIEELKQ